MKLLFLLSFIFAVSFSYAQVPGVKSPNGLRFDVDAVEVATVRLNEMNAQDAFENQLDREIQFFPDELENQTVVPGWKNCFIATIHKSFDQHRPLSFTPDAIWLTICQGVSIHINENFDELKSQIFKLAEPHKIRVRNDNLPEGSVHWKDLLHAFSDSTRKYVNDDYYSFFVPEFSTTSNIDLTSYEVTMLEGFSQAFEYFGDSGCGIPSITLQGTHEDWQAIYDRLDRIEELGMVLWAKELRGVLQQFINAYDKNVDAEFWQSIYKDHSEYGASYVSGWFIKFFPYLEGTGDREEIDDKSNEMYYSRAPKIYIPNRYLKGDDYLISRLSTDDFPSGISEIDVHWDDWGIKREMKVHAGFYGMKQYEDLTLEPVISWAVRDAKGSEANNNYDWVNIETEHRPIYWSPNAMEELEEVAIYDASSFSDATTSYAFVQHKIIDYIDNNTSFSSTDLEGKSVEILISSNGTVLECKSKELEESILSEITKAVQSLPKKWNPAKADFRKFVYDYYDEEDDGKIILIEANSWVYIEL